MSQEKLQTMIMQKNVWENEVNYGICARRELHLGCVSIAFVRLRKQIKQT